MKHKDERMDEYIREKLNKISHTPPRDPAQAAQTRASFLAQVHALSPGRDLSAPVPLSPSLRLKGWINQVFGSNTQKEGHRMLKAITALLVIGVMFFGGAGATVHAAQDALPNDALYPLKTATEDLRLAFALDAQSEIDLLLNYSDRRVGEIMALSQAGEAVPQDVIVRLSAEMDLLEDIITNLDEPEYSETVEIVGVHIWDRDRISWDVEDEMLRLTATRAWAEKYTLVCPDEGYVEGDECSVPLEKVCIDPLYDPLVEGSECLIFETYWTFAPPKSPFQNRLNRPAEAGTGNQPADEVITDPLTDAEIMSGTDGILIEGSANGAGPGNNDNAPTGPQSAQGNAVNRESDDPVAGSHESKGNTSPEPGYGQYDSNSQYLFLEYFNLPTPKAKGSGGSNKK